MSQRLTVVSNRLPITIGTGGELRSSVGGLVSAVDPVLRNMGGCWIGWAGTSSRRNRDLKFPGEPYAVHAVGLTQREMTRYYHGFSNRALWPLCHLLIERATFRTLDWRTYSTVNRRFALEALRHSKPGDMIWFHDYQLMTAPRYVREQVPDQLLGFFFHIPFPPFEVFRTLPWDKEVLTGMLGSDLIGFHVDAYVRSFLECVEKRVKVPVDFENGRIEFEDRVIKVSAYPLGIDFGMFDELARSGRDGAGDQDLRIILGVDRLDYTKGIPERIKAFELLLEKHPEYRERVVLVQVAVPSRSEVPEYRELKREIDELVGSVDGRFATPTWSPIRYLFRTLSRKALVDLYRQADVALVTPLRDGMNLVAKEFVACQTDDPGVLVLSRFTGAAETMREAVRVNPYDRPQVAEAIHRALSMPLDERENRMSALRERERRYDVHRWAEHFLDDLASTRREPVLR